MQIILLEHIRKLGRIGDEVTVRNGYARNFLLPQAKAILANKANRANFAAQRAVLEAHNLENRRDAQSLAEKIAGTMVIIIRQASESGQLYGSVTRRDIVASLAEAETSLIITTHQIGLTTTIKTLGIYHIDLALHAEVIAPISVNVARTLEEADNAKIVEGQEYDRTAAAVEISENAA